MSPFFMLLPLWFRPVQRAWTPQYNITSFIVKKKHVKLGKQKAKWKQAKACLTVGLQPSSRSVFHTDECLASQLVFSLRLPSSSSAPPGSSRPPPTAVCFRWRQVPVISPHSLASSQEIEPPTEPLGLCVRAHVSLHVCVCAGARACVCVCVESTQPNALQQTRSSTWTTWSELVLYSSV